MPAELTDRIPEIVAESEVRAAEVVAATCMAIEAGAKRNLVANGSVVTGNLVGSIEASVEVTSGEVGTAVLYAPYVEYGTGERGAESGDPEGKPSDITYSSGWPGMSARPYLTPAAETERIPFYTGISRIYG
jgi:phage gpG-like protein